MTCIDHICAMKLVNTSTPSYSNFEVYSALASKYRELRYTGLSFVFTWLSVELHGQMVHSIRRIYANTIQNCTNFTPTFIDQIASQCFIVTYTCIHHDNTQVLRKTMRSLMALMLLYFVLVTYPYISGLLAFGG